MGWEVTITHQGDHPTDKGDRDLWQVTAVETNADGDVVTQSGSQLVGTERQARTFAKTIAGAKAKVTVHRG